MDRPTDKKKSFYLNVFPYWDSISNSARTHIYGLNKTSKKLELKIIFILFV